MKVKIKDLSVYLLAVFIIMKIWRAYSGSTEQGGVWNYIQIVFVFLGMAAFLWYFLKVLEAPGVLILAVYSIWSFFLSIVTVSEFTISSLFGILKVLLPGMALVLFYIYRTETDELNKHHVVLKGAFYISSAILTVRLGSYMLSGGLRASGAGAVADVYYIVGLMPFILAITNANMRVVPFFVTGICVLLSQKRAGLIAFIGALVIFYVIEAIKEQKRWTSIGKILTLIVVLIIGYYVMLYMDSAFNLNIFTRLQKLADDGGSGRNERWECVWDALKNSIWIQNIFGHGFGGVYDLLNSHAHNDFLEVAYDYGLVSAFLYVFYYISLIYTAVKMFIDKYEHCAEMMASIFISLCIAMFSYYVTDATYIICGCFVQGVLIADWNCGKQSKLQRG